MFEFYYDSYSKEQCAQYLERIDFHDVCERNRETLNCLIYQHQCHVPFENLDLYPEEHSISLHAEQLFRKVVEKRRGGICFELNGAFQAFLRGMGFDAYSSMGRVAFHREILGNLSHRVTIVRLGSKKYLADVGLGGPMAPFAVELDERHQSFYGETYWVEKTYENWYLLKRGKNGVEEPVIIFSAQPFLSKDFQPLCRALLESPESSFKKQRIVNLRLPDGSLELKGDILTVQKDGKKEKLQLTESNLEQVLTEKFQLSVEG